jgi:Tol biopolymer transport system component/DNA-binding winged helix-turn-helix (wHTH) protein
VNEALRPGFELGDWVVDVTGNRLVRGAEVRPLRHKAMEVLVLLAENAGQTVSRETLEQAIWQGNSFVAPKAINTAVWTIRQALGDDPETPHYLETIAKKGYRLVAPVRVISGAAAGAAPGPAADTATASAPSAAPPGSAGAAPSPRPSRAAWMLGAAGLTAAAAVLLWPRQQARPDAPQAAAVAPTYRQVVALTQEPGVEYLGQLSPDGRKLAFGWWQGRGTGQLYVRELPPPGAAASASPQAPPMALSSDAGEVQGFSWAPDGRSLAYAATPAGGPCTLWVQPLDGPRRALATCAAIFTPTVAWSPDGRHIAFSGEAEGAGGLFLIAPDGSGLRRLSTAPPAAMPDHQPAWSPDGRRLAFAREDPADGTRDLHEATLDGSVQRLTSLKLNLLHGITYAADGQDLIFSTTQQDRRALQRWDRRGAQAVPLGLEGSAPTRAPDGGLVYALLRTHVSIARLQGREPPQRLLHAVASDRAPRLDSGGQRVAFVSRRSGAQELWTAMADGAQARALTALDGHLGEPAWQPGGEHLAFLGNCGPGKRFGLCVIAAAGGTPRPLAADAANYGRPAWHPTRAEVWVPSDRGGRWQLWRFPLDGSAPDTLATAEPPGRGAQWAPDGRSLVYQPRGARHLQWRAVGATAPERRLDVAATGEELVDWRLHGGGVRTLTRGDRERWRQLDLVSGRRQALGEHSLGSFPERASFDIGPDGTVLVEMANSDVADIMLAR